MSKYKLVHKPTHKKHEKALSKLVNESNNQFLIYDKPCTLFQMIQN